MNVFHHKKIAGDNEIPSEDEGGDDQTLARFVSDDDENPSEKEEGDDRTTPQLVPYEDEISSEYRKGVERILLNCKTAYSEICLFDDIEEIILFK